MNRRINKAVLLGVLALALLGMLAAQVGAGTPAKPPASIAKALMHATIMVVSGQDGSAQDIAQQANKAIVLVRKVVFYLPDDNPHATEASILLKQAIVYLQQALIFGFKDDAPSAYTYANKGLHLIERAVTHVEPSHYTHQFDAP